jgi:hypothetical protein
VTVHLITPQWDDAHVPRAWPCTAGGIGPHAQECGATPAGLWERYCDNGHARKVHLCGSHALLITRGFGRCADCSDRGVTCAAKIRPVDLPLAGYRLPGGGMLGKPS